MIYKRKHFACEETLVSCIDWAEVDLDIVVDFVFFVKGICCHASPPPGVCVHVHVHIHVVVVIVIVVLVVDRVDDRHREECRCNEESKEWEDYEGPTVSWIVAIPGCKFGLKTKVIEACVSIRNVKALCVTHHPV